MPLIKSASRAAVGTNIGEMLASGHPRAQAIAAALDTARRAKRAPGGPVMPPAAGLGALPATQGGIGSLAGRPPPTGTPGLPTGISPMGRPPGPPPMAAPGSHGGGLGALGAPPGAPPMGGMRPPGMAAGGNPIASTPYFAKAEARQMGHVGPVIGASMGRGDSKNISVPGGSYVLPSSHVSALGQGNSLAGHAIINSMFGGGTGPGGASIMHGGHGMGPPRPPSVAGGFAKGGAPKEGGIVPIRISDGEHVLSPDQVKMVGHGDIENGHKILDAWVKYERDKQVKTLRKLPGPAKD